MTHRLTTIVAACSTWRGAQIAGWLRDGMEAEALCTDIAELVDAVLAHAPDVVVVDIDACRVRRRVIEDIASVPARWEHAELIALVPPLYFTQTWTMPRIAAHAVLVRQSSQDVLCRAVNDRVMRLR